MQAQQARADAWKVPHQGRRGAGCSGARPSASCRTRPTRRSISSGGAAREGEQQEARRIGAGEHQLGDARRQRQRLARAGAGDDQERPAGRPRRAEAEPGGARAGRRSARQGATSERQAARKERQRSSRRERRHALRKASVRDCKSIQPRERESCTRCAARTASLRRRRAEDPHALGFETGPTAARPVPHVDADRARLAGRRRSRPAAQARAAAGARRGRGARPSADDGDAALRAPVRGRMARPAVRARRRRRADRLVAVQGARGGRRHRARPAARAGARRRRQRRPAARRHEPRAGQRSRRIPGDARLQRLDAALDAPEGAQRRDPRRSLDGSARRRRHRRREQRRRPARPRLLRSRLLPARRATATAPTTLLRRAAAEDRRSTRTR